MRGSDFPYGDYQLTTEYASNKYVKYSDTEYVDPFVLTSIAGNLTCTSNISYSPTIRYRSIDGNVKSSSYVILEESHELRTTFTFNINIQGTINYVLSGVNKSKSINESYTRYLQYNNSPINSYGNYYLAIGSTNCKVGKYLQNYFYLDHKTIYLDDYPIDLSVSSLFVTPYNGWVFNGTNEFEVSAKFNKIIAIYNNTKVETSIDTSCNTGLKYMLTTSFSYDEATSWREQAWSSKDYTDLYNNIKNGTTLTVVRG